MSVGGVLLQNYNIYICKYTMQIKPADLMSAGGTLMIIEPLTQCQQGVYPCFQDFLNKRFKYQKGKKMKKTPCTLNTW